MAAVLHVHEGIRRCASGSNNGSIDGERAMSIMLILVLLVATAGIFWALNHALARLTYVELVLTNGHRQNAGPVQQDAGTGMVQMSFQPDVAARVLPSNALALFASNTCVTCVRLIDELGAPDVALRTPLHSYFIGAKPSIAIPGEWSDRQQELFDEIGVPTTPYAVLITDGNVVAHGPVANPANLQALLQRGGAPDQLPVRLLGDQMADAS